MGAEAPPTTLVPSSVFDSLELIISTAIPTWDQDRAIPPDLVVVVWPCRGWSKGSLETQRLFHAHVCSEGCLAF